jgi:hypothetical protein
LNIIQAIKDPQLFRPFFGDDLSSWRAWLVALRVVYGLPIRTNFARDLIRQCTGRDPAKLPKNGFQTALFLTGRRSGKSRIASVIGAHSAALAGLEANLSAGERGIVPVVSPSKRQSHMVMGIAPAHVAHASEAKQLKYLKQLQKEAKAARAKLREAEENVTDETPAWITARERDRAVDAERKERLKRTIDDIRL